MARTAKAHRWPAWAGPALAAVLLAVPAAAQDVVPLGRVTATLESPWPHHRVTGLAPLLVTLRNTADRPLTVSIEADSTSRVSFVASAEREVPPGGVEHVVLPMLSARWSMWNGVTLRADGERAQVSVQGVAYANEDDATLPVLYVAARRPPAGAAEAWSAELSQRPRAEQAFARHRRSRSSGRLMLGIHPVERRQLPRRADYYTSLHVVMVDASLDPDPVADWQGILGWVRAGGRLLVIGPESEEWLRAQPGLEDWLEPRLAWPVGSSYATLHRYGLGLVGWTTAAGPDQQEVQMALVDVAAEAPEPGPERSPWPAALAGIQVPRRALTVALILFVILIWPVNFAFVRRRGKPILLLLTVPLIAGVSSLLMLAYGTLAQGLDIKAASRSFTVLDQRSHRATAREFRQLFAGLAPGHGLRPASGTVVLPRVDLDDWRQEDSRYRVEASGGWQLRGDFLPPRQRVDQLVITDGAARQRLVVRREGDVLKVQNGLGTELVSLVVRDPEGRFYGSGRSLAEGGEATLEPMGPQGPGSWLIAQDQEWLLSWPGSERASENIPPGSYVARVRRGVWCDATGLELNHVGDEVHALLGVLPLDGEEWR